MNTSTPHFSRRTFLSTAAGAAGPLLVGGANLTQGRHDAWAAPKSQSSPPSVKPLPRVAAINSIYRLRSHAYHIAGRFIHGYTRDGFHHQPPFRLARMYNHQYPKDDLSRGVCAKHKIGLAKTVAEALGGPDSLDVDAVLLIIEHGDYPVNKFGQILYPRYELFEEIVEVFRRSKRTVPVFVDKHLSYDHTQAARMVATAKKMGFGLMAGSSLPVTWRRPEIEPPLGTRFREAVVTYGQERPPYDIYLFHALESLQCMLERRAGGETGVRSVTFLSGDDVWKAGDAGKWSWALAEASLSRAASLNYGTVREQVSHPRAILVDYQDGTRGAVLNFAEKTSELCFAGKIEGRGTPMSTRLVLPAPPGARFFDPLVNNIEKFFATGKSPYPVERTLLTSTILDLAMSQSAPAKGKPISSPTLGIQYQPVQDSGFFRGSYIDAGGD